MRVELIIHALPTLPNRLLGAHWRVRSRNANKWRKLVATVCDIHKTELLQRTPKEEWPMVLKAIPKAKILFTRCSPRQCDFDNLVCSFKPVLDSLVSSGIIEDDSPNHVICSYEWLKTPTKEQCVRIVVEGI